jgi:RNA polymerase sigma-70 factor (ECF subfamily)
MLSPQTSCHDRDIGHLPEPNFPPTPKEPDGDECALLAGLLGDDAHCWRLFSERYSRLIYSCITRVTARFPTVVGPEDVREIHGMLFVQLLANDKRKLQSFEPGRGTKLSSWIGMLAMHTAYDYLRGVRREPQRGSLDEAEQLVACIPDPYQALESRERARAVAAVLQSFSDRDRQFVSMYYGQGLEPEQIASSLGISVKTVYSKKHKIRARLESLLAEDQLAA